jgi:hypothetical protein
VLIDIHPAFFIDIHGCDYVVPIEIVQITMVADGDDKLGALTFVMLVGFATDPRCREQNGY